MRARAGRRACAPCGAGGIGREAALEPTWAGNKPDADGVLAGAAVHNLLPPPPDAAAGVCAGGGCGGRGDAWTVTARSQVGEKLGGSAVDSTGPGGGWRVITEGSVAVIGAAAVADGCKSARRTRRFFVAPGPGTPGDAIIPSIEESISVTSWFLGPLGPLLLACRASSLLPMTSTRIIEHEL